LSQLNFAKLKKMELIYRLTLFKDRLFIQPSIAITHCAFHTTMSDGFKQLDDKWSKFVFGEPGFHFGYNF